MGTQTLKELTKRRVEANRRLRRYKKELHSYELAHFKGAAAEVYPLVEASEKEVKAIELEIANIRLLLSK